MEDNRQKARAYFRANLLKHLVHLKFMRLYGEAVGCTFIERQGAVAVLLDYPVALVPRDALSYPMAEQVFLPVAQNVEMAQVLLDYLQENHILDRTRIIKFCEAETEVVFQEALPLQLVNTVISYTNPLGSRYELVTDVRVEKQPPVACIQLYVENGYSSEELEKYFQNGATAFTLYCAENPICTCMAYQNFDEVWEIGGLHTRENWRGRGLARQVVQTALWSVLLEGNIPRYQVEYSNRASIRVAEALGLQACLHFRHLLYEPGS